MTSRVFYLFSVCFLLTLLCIQIFWHLKSINTVCSRYKVGKKREEQQICEQLEEVNMSTGGREPVVESMNERDQTARPFIYHQS